MIQFSHERNSLIQFEHTTEEINAHLYLYSKKLLDLAREEMMKDAADSKITTDGNSIFPIIKYQLPLTYDCKIGDRVKLIIIKEEQQ